MALIFKPSTRSTASSSSLALTRAPGSTRPLI
jgi:hypothetical protein